ncbi:reverse transcriptase domain-containing protein [Tanacetum coccineum]
MPQPRQNLKDSSDPITEMNKALVVVAKAFKINTIPTNNNQISSLIPHNCQIAQPGMNTSQDIKMQMVDDNLRNQVRHNAVQNDGNEVWQNTVQNPGIQIVGNMNRLSVVSEIANQYGNVNFVTTPAEGNGNGINGNSIRCYNCQGEGHYASNYTVKSRKRDVAYLQQLLRIAQEEEAGIQSTQEEFKFMTAADAHEETERVKVNCTSEDTLQQASTSGTQSDNAPVYDSDGSAEVPNDENGHDHDIFNMLTQEVQYTDLQTELDPYNDMQQKIKRLQAQLGDLKGKSSDTQCASNTPDPVSHKLEDKNVSLEFQVRNYSKENEHLKTTYKNLFVAIKVTQAQTNSIIDSLQKQLYDTIYENAKLRAQLFDKVSEQKGTTKGTRMNTMFTKQSILGKPPSSSDKPKLYSVTPFPKSSVLPKVDKTNALSKSVTSNSAPSIRESKVVQTVNVIAPRIFRTNPSKTSRVDNVVPNKPVKTSVRIKPITVSKQNVIHKQQANSDSNGFSSTRVNNTAKTRRPHPMSNSNTDRVPSKSKSGCLSNNVKKIEENHRNSQIPNNQKRVSSECNNITLAIRNAKSEIVCVMCKQCLVIANHDVCVFNYVNDMNSRADNQSANVSIRENQKKHKANAKKLKELGSKGSLASSRPNKPRTCLRWIPTGRIFAMCGKLTASSNTENKSKKSMCDNASTSNPSKPSSKGFLNSASLRGSQIANRSTKKKGVYASSALYLKKRRNLLFHFHRYDSHEDPILFRCLLTADASDKCQQQQDSTSSTSTLATAITADGNFDLIDDIEKVHVNIEILKENKNLRTELKELKAITETWLNSSNKVNQYISEKIPSQKKRIMGVDQFTKDPSSSGQKDLVFVKSSADDTKVTILGVERPWFLELKGFILPNYDILCGSYDHDTNGHNRIISLKREINPRNHQHAFKRCEACDSSTHTTTDHYDIEWFKRGEALQAKKAEALKSTRAESSNANRSKTPTKSGCSRHMTGVKSYLHKYVEQPGPKVVFGDDSTCTTEGYGSIKCNGIVFTKVAFVNGLKYNLISISQLCDAKYIVQFDEKRGTIFNSNKEVVMIAPRVRDVYVLDMTSSAQESCFFAKASDNLNWLWHKRLAHLNFKTINKLAKQNLVIGLPSLYSRYTWVYFLKKKNHAPEIIISLIKRVENQNDIKVKQLRTDNGNEFKNSILVNFCDEKGISQNFSSPNTPEQNGIAERKNRNLIEATRTMLLRSVFLKQYWTEAVATACYTQHRYQENPKEFHLIIVKRIFREAFTRTPNQYKEYVSKFWYIAKPLKNSKVWFSTPTGGILGEVGVTTFKNAIGANYLSHSTKYAEVPSLETVRAWFSTIGYKGKTGGFDQILNKDATILYFLSNGVDIDYARLIWEDIINKLNKKTREKVVPYPRFLSLLSEHKIEGYGNDNVTLNPTQMSLWHSELLEPPQKLRRRLPKAQSMELSSSSKDTNQSQPLASTPVVVGMHKDVEQATGGPTSLGVTSEERINPQLSRVHIPQLKLILENLLLMTLYLNNKKTKSVSEGLEIVLTKPATRKGASYIEKEIEYAEEEFNTSPNLFGYDDTKKEIKLGDLSKMVPNLDVDFMDLDSPKDDQPIIFEDEEEEEVHARKDDVEKSQNLKLKKEKIIAEAEVAFLSAQTTYPNVEQLTELLVKSLSPELSKLLSSHNLSSSLLTKLKELPSKFNDLTREIEKLKKHVHELENELPGDLKAKIKTLDALPSLLSMVTEALDRFAQAVDPSKSSPQTEGELIKKDNGKKTMYLKDVEEEGTKSKSHKANLTGLMGESSKKKKLKKFDFETKGGELGKEELVNLLGIDVVKGFYKAKLQSTKFNSSVQYEDHPVGTVLNEPCLGMIMLPLKTLEISQMRWYILYNKSSSDFIKVLG